MNPIKLSFLLAAFLIVSHTAGAQQEQDETSQPKSAVSFVPQYLIQNGIRIDYDLKIKDHHWLQVCPQFYLREKNVSAPDGYYGNYDYDPNIYYEDNSDDESYFNNLLGGGLNLYHRYYPGNSFKNHMVYVNYGVMAQYFNIKYDEQLYSGYAERYTQIFKTGGDINLGVVTFLNDYIGIDIYAGLGFRYSNRKSDADNPRKFNNFFESYGYSGNIVNLGVRFILYNY
jgi:hypothetical protein